MEVAFLNERHNEVILDNRKASPRLVAPSSCCFNQVQNQSYTYIPSTLNMMLLYLDTQSIVCALKKKYIFFYKRDIMEFLSVDTTISKKNAHDKLKKTSKVAYFAFAWQFSTAKKTQCSFKLFRALCMYISDQNQEAKKRKILTFIFITEVEIIKHVIKEDGKEVGKENSFLEQHFRTLFFYQGKK